MHRITDQFALAPDGSRVVYVARAAGRTDLYEQRFSELDPRLIPGTAGARAPVFFSPDSRWVGFGQDNTLRRIRPDGSDLATIAPLGARHARATWGADGTIVVSTGDSDRLLVVNVEGGTLVPLRVSDTTAIRTLADPHFLPDGQTLLCNDLNDEGRTNIVAITVRSGAVKLLGVGSTPRFVPPDLIVFGRSDGSLYIQHLNRAKMELTGPARRLLEGVSTIIGLFSYYDVARDGHLVYLVGRAGTASLSLVDQQGKATPLLRGERFWVPRVSPDGRHIAYGGYSTGVLADIWLYDVRLGTAQRLTSDTLDYNDPVWSPDGKELAVSA